MTADVYKVNTPKPYHHGDLRRALVEAASEILETEGREALTLRAVASRAGVSAMAPYRHFADKSALLVEVGTLGFVRLQAALAEADAAAADPRAALVAQAGVHVRFAAAHPDLFRLMFGPDPRIGGDPAEMIGQPDTAYGTFARRIVQLFGPDETPVAILTCWSFVHGLATLVVDRRLPPGADDVDALVRQAASFLIARLAPG